MSIQKRIEKLEAQAAPKAETKITLLLPSVTPGYVAMLCGDGPDRLLTKEERDEYCAASPNMVTIRPHDEAGGLKRF